MASTSYIPETTWGAIHAQMSDTSPNGELATDTKIGIVVGLVLFVLLLLGFYLVANTRRRRHVQTESVLPTHTHDTAAATIQANYLRRWRKSPSVYSAQSDDFVASPAGMNSAIPSGYVHDIPLSAERQAAHLAKGRRSRASTFSAKTADSSSTESQAVELLPPPPAKHRARSSDVSQANVAYS
ncbi:hypothetical protein QCA50_006573 [Cerrena zonata]|uniref:Uncharacterized protein n=1 Tax=Cerrena zonata TaxID=2478898 RepID=A0AAW0G8F3_9APHY